MCSLLAGNTGNKTRHVSRCSNTKRRVPPALDDSAWASELFFSQARTKRPRVFLVLWHAHAMRQHLTAQRRRPRRRPYTRPGPAQIAHTPYKYAIRHSGRGIKFVKDSYSSADGRDGYISIRAVPGVPQSTYTHRKPNGKLESGLLFSFLKEQRKAWMGKNRIGRNNQRRLRFYAVDALASPLVNGQPKFEPLLKCVRISVSEESERASNGFHLRKAPKGFSLLRNSRRVISFCTN